MTGARFVMMGLLLGCAPLAEAAPEAPAVQALWHTSVGDLLMFSGAHSEPLGSEWTPVEPPPAPAADGPVPEQLADLHTTRIYHHTMQSFVVGCGPRELALDGEAYVFRRPDASTLIQGWKVDPRPDCPTDAWLVLAHTADAADVVVREVDADAEALPADVAPEPRRTARYAAGKEHLLLAWSGDTPRWFRIGKNGPEPLGKLHLAQHQDETGATVPFAVCVKRDLYVLDVRDPVAPRAVRAGRCRRR